MAEKILYEGEKNVKSITLEFSCKCGEGFEVIINPRDNAKTKEREEDKS